MWSNTLVNTHFIGSIGKAWHRWLLFPWKTFHLVSSNYSWFLHMLLTSHFYLRSQILFQTTNSYIQLPTQFLTLMSYSNTSLTRLKLNSPRPPTPSCFLLVFQISINGNSILLLYQKSYGHLWLSPFSHSMSYPSAIPADFKNTAHINHFSLSPHPTISCLYYFNSLLTSLQNSTLLTF